MYESDGLDILGLGGFPPLEIDRARQRHAGEYVSTPRLHTAYVGFNVRQPPFDDLRVRRAFALATDKETLADVILRGYSFPATGGFVPPEMPGHSEGIALPYNPARAGQLLAEAGYPAGQGFPAVEWLISRGRESGADYLQMQWRENLRVALTWETMDLSTLSARMHSLPPHMYFCGWVADYPDPDSFLRLFSLRRWSGWRNRAYDKLIEKGRRVLDQGKRMKLYGQADKILVDEAAIVPLTYPRDHLLVKPWVSKYPTSALAGWFWKDVIIEPH
jgi:oligopeptide transport system substrate-binding protein